jgi:putative membrane protein
MQPGMQPGMHLDDATKTNMLLRQIHGANQDEIDMGKVALDKAQSPEVKKFANQMVTDHTAADQKLTDMAKKMNFDINAAPHDPLALALQSSAEDSKRALRGMSGAQFDVAYIAPQVVIHNDALHIVEEAQKTATGDAKAFLDQTRPVIEAHLDHAKTLQRGLMFSPTAVGGGPAGSAGAEGTPAPGAVQGMHGKGDAGHRDDMKKNAPKSNP